MIRLVTDKCHRFYGYGGVLRSNCLQYQRKCRAKGTLVSCVLVANDLSIVVCVSSL